MSEPTQDDGGPVFPHPETAIDIRDEHGRTISTRVYDASFGVSLRDYFAAQALAGQLASLSTQSSVETMKSASDPFLWAAMSAYNFADAMLKARAAK
jgi:hypothetical protein